MHEFSFICHEFRVVHSWQIEKYVYLAVFKETFHLSDIFWNSCGSVCACMRVPSPLSLRRSYVPNVKLIIKSQYCHEIYLHRYMFHYRFCFLLSLYFRNVFVYRFRLHSTFDNVSLIDIRPIARRASSSVAEGRKKNIAKMCK